MHLRRLSLSCVFFLAVALPSAEGAGVRDFTRTPAPRGTTIDTTQASELTLTLTEVAMRPIQRWVRTAGTLDKTGKMLTTFVAKPEADLVLPGQRFRAFTVNNRTQMHLGKIAQVRKRADGAIVEGALPAQAIDIRPYLMEIVAESDPVLSIPNVSIIEEGSQHIVYVQMEPGRYEPREINIGVQGELYTEVLDGLKDGDQVVSIGSFFIDAETKLKSAGMMAAMPGMDMSNMDHSMPGMDMSHGSMPGMDHSAMEQIAANAPTSQPDAAPSLVMTDPAPDTKATAPLYMIHAMFNTPVDPKTSGFEVTDSNGKPVDVGALSLMGNDGKMLMAMPKTPLPAGTYKVKWHAMAGTKKLEGEFSFTVQ